MDPILPASDHDILIGLKTMVEFIRTDIKELKESLAARVTALERDKVAKSDELKAQAEITAAHLDHENRIRTLEKGVDSLDKSTTSFQSKMITWGSAAILLLGILEVIVQVWHK